MLSDVAVLSARWRLKKCQVTVVNDDRRRQEHVRGARHSRWRCPGWSDGSPRDHESPWRSYCICPPEQFRQQFHPAAHWIQPLSFQQSAKHNNQISKRTCTKCVYMKLYFIIYGNSGAMYRLACTLQTHCGMHAAIFSHTWITTQVGSLVHVRVGSGC